jgi:hypothetical protein
MFVGCLSSSPNPDAGLSYLLDACPSKSNARQIPGRCDVRGYGLADSIIWYITTKLTEIKDIFR